MAPLYKDEVLENLTNWERGIPQAPVRLILYLTTRCNLRCPFCEVPVMWRQGKSEPELSLKEWQSIIRQGLRMGVKEWWFPGQGEPFYPPERALTIIRQIKKHYPEAYCHFTTNGTLLDQRTCRQLVNLGVDDLNFSIDAPDAETHDLMRGQKGAFKKATTAMKTLSHMKKESGSDLPMMKITTVLSARNYSCIPEMVRMASEVGAIEVSINPLRISKGNQEGLEKYGLKVPKSLEDSVRDVLQSARREGEQRGIRVQLNGWGDIEMGVGSNKPAEGFRATKAGRFIDAACFEPYYTMGIGSSGKATFCASSSDVGTPDADVLRYGLEDVWYGRFMMEARARLLDHRPVINCFGCGIKSVRKHLKEEMDHRVVR